MIVLSETAWVARYPVGFVVALILALYFTPILREAARAFGIVDHPDAKLKTHRSPIPYMGGVAIFLAFVISLGLTISLFDQNMLGLLLGASIILLLGLVDDLKALSPAVKLLGQLLAAFVLIKAGIRIEIAFLKEYSPFLTDALTVLWIVGITNAFNIIDVMDGLASGVGFVALTILFTIAVMSGDLPGIALFTICLSGAVLGFLHFNLSPASIFLGDAGSMLIGFLVGSISMILSYANQNPFAVASPLLILGIPIFDTMLVMVLRLRQNRPLFQGSPDHFAVRLLRAGFRVRTIVFGSYIASLLMGASALWLMFLDRDQSIALLAAWAVAALIVGVFVATVDSRARRARNAAAKSLVRSS